MTFKKTLSSILALSQLSWASLSWGVPAAFAGPAPAQAATPELSLLSSVMTLEGQKLPAPELAQEVQSRFEQYDRAAPQADRLQRIGQALVTMGVYTPGQASAFETQLRSTAQTLSSTSFSSQTEMRQALEKSLANIALQSNGAQFSGCRAAYDVWGSATLIFLGSLIGCAAINNWGEFDQDAWIAEAGAGVMLLGFFVSSDLADANGCTD